MATIKITDADGKAYELTYTLKSVKQMADNGFNIVEASNNPVSGIPRLFAGAFIANHRTVPQAKIDELWNGIDDKEGFVSVLVDLYNEPINKLFGEPEANAKKVTWEVVK